MLSVRSFPRRPTSPCDRLWLAANPFLNMTYFVTAIMKEIWKKIEGRRKMLCHVISIVEKPDSLAFWIWKYKVGLGRLLSHWQLSFSPFRPPTAVVCTLTTPMSQFIINAPHFFFSIILFCNTLPMDYIHYSMVIPNTIPKHLTMTSASRGRNGTYPTALVTVICC